MEKKTYDQMNNLNKTLFALSGLISTVCTNDDYWRIFGFKSCPRRGKYFDFLISKDRLRMEDFILKELLLLSTIDCIRAVKNKISSNEDCQLYVVGLLSVIYKQFAKIHFYSEKPYLNFFETGVYDYSVHNCEISFENRVKEALDIELCNELITGFKSFIGSDRSRYISGIFLDIEVISEYISSDISADEFIFHSNNQVLKEFNISSSEVIRILDNIDLQFAQEGFN